MYRSSSSTRRKPTPVTTVFEASYRKNSPIMLGLRSHSFGEEKSDEKLHRWRRVLSNYQSEYALISEKVKFNYMSWDFAQKTFPRSEYRLFPTNFTTVELNLGLYITIMGVAYGEIFDGIAPITQKFFISAQPIVIPKSVPQDAEMDEDLAEAIFCIVEDPLVTHLIYGETAIGKWKARGATGLFPIG